MTSHEKSEVLDLIEIYKTDRRGVVLETLLTELDSKEASLTKAKEYTTKVRSKTTDLILLLATSMLVLITMLMGASMISTAIVLCVQVIITISVLSTIHKGGD